MYVYRIGRTKYAKDLSGEGSKLQGGRWNHIGISCIYTAESRALAMLEYAANVNLDILPRSLSITVIEFPDRSWIEYDIAKLPGNWKDNPTPVSTKDYGTHLLTNAKSLAIKIPSAIIPLEYNYLVNPLHKDIVHVKIIDITDFIFDIRVKN